MPHYADRIWHGTVTIEENVRLARDTYRVRFACPEIAGRVVPGQFVMLRPALGNDPLLGRALAVYDATLDGDGRPRFLDLVYLVVGKMTRLLAEALPGSRFETWGPLGNGFFADSAESAGGSVPFKGTVPFLLTQKSGQSPSEHLVMVAGGIGQTPFLLAAREALGLRTFGDPPRTAPQAAKVTLCYGARTGEYLAGVEDFRRAGVEVHLSTDDGTIGHRGLVTELIRPVVERSAEPCRLICCGPEPMLKAAVALAKELSVPCQVSLESPMACGIGACYSCAAKIRDASGGWDYRRTCVEGPVFDAADVEF